MHDFKKNLMFNSESKKGVWLQVNHIETNQEKILKCARDVLG